MELLEKIAVLILEHYELKRKTAPLFDVLTKERKHKVAITNKHIELLAYCAKAGIRTKEDMEKQIGMKLPRLN